MTSILTENQVRTFAKEYTQAGTSYRITAEVRHDDRNGNGHNTFSITGSIDRKASNGRWVDHSGGTIHEDIAKRFPALAPLIKWHLCSTDGPMHYIANTIYWVREGNLDFARKTAIWPDATVDDLNQENLEGRLPSLLEEFKKAVESLGFTY